MLINLLFQSNNLRLKYSHGHPVLTCTFQDPIHVWSGSLDGALKTFDINSSSESTIGQHENAIRYEKFFLNQQNLALQSYM